MLPISEVDSGKEEIFARSNTFWNPTDLRTLRTLLIMPIIAPPNLESRSPLSAHVRSVKLAPRLIFAEFFFLSFMLTNYVRSACNNNVFALDSEPPHSQATRLLSPPKCHRLWHA
ncbi:hypothetical protein L596_011125 [Steinernema carpocapsae]|uniref:Uncharacterized protein n=1 Tax=Steinernema carpocapsae TaxID=34508 RepID=A0A4U5NTP6_STECR|nr:hypothetical protein L596_011125 [Steinernema carpocapsae]